MAQILLLSTQAREVTMIYIDKTSLSISLEISNAFDLRRVAYSDIPVEEIKKGDPNNHSTLVCGIIHGTKDPQKVVNEATEKAVRKGIQRLVIVDETKEMPGIESLKNGRIIIINADFKSTRFSSEFLVSLIISIVAENAGYVLKDKASEKLFDIAERVAKSDVGVFINGPTGTGKEVLSNFLHEHSCRKNEKFIALNCAAIPDHMLEAMLFGHLKGAFTGAASHSKGIFRAADKGTLLLDEISEMPLSLQAKLLRMLQERAVTPVGGTESIPCDVRVLATSNRNMEIEVQEGRFREDLYYRLNVFPLTTLPLENRKKDILALSAHMLIRHNKDWANLPFLTTAAANRLQSYNWPGNVRELENVVQRATVLAADNIIEEHDILINSQTFIGQIIPPTNNEKSLART